MAANFWLGLNGVPPGERNAVYLLERRVGPVMVLIALLAALRINREP